MIPLWEQPVDARIASARQQMLARRLWYHYGPTLFLTTLNLMLQITLQLVQDMPADQKAAAWKRHADHVEWLQTFFDRVKPHTA